MSSWTFGRIARWAVLFAILGGLGYLWFRPGEDFQLEWARDRKNVQGLVRYVDQGGNAGKVRGDLKRHHAAARAKLAEAGAGADAPIAALLDALLAVTENRVVLEMPAAMVTVDRASFGAMAALLAEPGTFVAPVSHHLDEPGYDCAKGVEVVFEQALGGDVVEVQIARFIDGVDRGRPVLTMGWTVRAGTTAYARANGKRVYPSLEVDAELTLRVRGEVLTSVTATARPAADIQYTTYGIMPAMDVMYPDSDASDDEVFGGIVASTCEALGRQLMAELTGMTAEPAVPGDPGLAHDEKWCKQQKDAASCARLGIRYRDGDGVLVDTAKAEQLLHDACRGGLGAGAAGCAPAAALTLARATDVRAPASDLRARAMIALMNGCHHHDAESCLALGDLRTLPYEGETTLSEHGAREASLAYLHACDLGHPDACGAASRLLEPYEALEAHLLARRACAADVAGACAAEKALARRAAAERTVFGVALGRGDEPFDVHWATLFDGDETATIWIASREATTAVEQRLAAALAAGTAQVAPAGTSLPPPAWAKTTYLLGNGPTATYHDKCPRCPHQRASPFSLLRCTCLP